MTTPARDFEGRRLRRRQGGALLAAALLLALLAAVGCQSGAQTSGESHFGRTKAFLRVCEDGVCGDGDTCVCAVCTVECGEAEECRQRILGDGDEELPASVVCRAPLCADNTNDEANPSVGSVCDVECTEDADCAFLDGDHDGPPHFCNGGYCRTLAEPDAPVAPGEPLVVCPAGMELVPGSALPGGVGSCLDRTEVTVAEYTACVDAGVCAEPEAGNFLTAGREQHPIQFVSEADAAAYCAFRGARLPVLDEWRAAASGGTDATAYPWGDEVPAADDDPQRVCGLGAATTCPVASFPAGDGPWGHADLAGNVSEWVITTDGACLAGGDFQSAPEELTADTCPAGDGAAPAETIGFRCAGDL